MFSANENLLLRQHKRRVVGWVEATMPEHVLDAGTNVMVMQVACKAPGCVPIETAIIVVFPQSDKELLEGLVESRNGGAYKTKILKPMDQVTQDDVLDALPPAFEGGRRSMERLCIQARDIMLGQITQLFAEDDVEGRRLMAEYLMQSLQLYVDRKCEPPEWGEAFPEDGPAITENESVVDSDPGISTSMVGAENIVLKRPTDGDTLSSTVSSFPAASQSFDSSNFNTNHLERNSVSSRRHQQVVTRRLDSISSSTASSSSSSLLARLSEREHAPGIRRPGCPCCDPDNPANASLMYQMMQL